MTERKNERERERERERESDRETGEKKERVGAMGREVSEGELHEIQRYEI